MWVDLKINTFLHGSTAIELQFTSGMALTIKNLHAVHTAVFEARTKWYDIGLGLNVGPDTLDSISIDTQFHNPGEKLRETLKVWLKTDTEPTWQDIVGVLKSHVVGESKLASDIEADDEHCTTPEASGQTVPKVQQPQPTKVASKLDKKKTQHDQINRYPGCGHSTRPRRLITYQCTDTFCLCENCAYRTVTCPYHPRAYVHSARKL